MTSSGRSTGPAAAREAWELIAEFFLSDEMHERVHDACEMLDVTPPMLKTMLRLEPGDSLPMGALADELRCDASWVTSLVDGLEERGFAERQMLPTDRRVKTIVLTEDGLLARKRALDVMNEPPPSFGNLNAAEARELRDLLHKACSG